MIFLRVLNKRPESWERKCRGLKCSFIKTRVVSLGDLLPSVPVRASQSTLWFLPSYGKQKDKRIQIWTSVVPDFCMLKQSAAFTYLEQKSDVCHPHTSEAEWMWSWTANVAGKVVPSKWFFLLQNNFFILLQFTLRLLFNDLVERYRRMLWNCRRKWFCLWERPCFSHPKGMT